MRFSFAFSALLLGELAYAEYDARNAFKKAERTIPATPEHPRLNKRASPFYTEKTKRFWVNGKAIPDVPFDVGESYAGLLPISTSKNETRELYFWFFPSANPKASGEITLWLNGGPGCSSLRGLLTENGPFTWMPGTFKPVQNSYSWTNLTNVLWIEQPVGTGYSQGVPNITNEVELGLQFIGFYKNFVDTFNIHKYKVYITGESYAGFYVPYIADAFITANNTDYFNLKGIAINNALIGDRTVAADAVMAPFVNHWSQLFFLNQTFLTTMNERAAACNYTAYVNKYLRFPPPQEKFPLLPPLYTDPVYTCDMYSDISEAATLVNPCWNLYHVTETCPRPYNVLGGVNDFDYVPPGLAIYFNRSDVQTAINAPHVNWFQCTDVNVFANQPTRSTNYSIGNDKSPGPGRDGALQRVIEYTNNVIIGSGNLDFVLPTNGSLLSLQNVTWNGLQGLQSYPGKPFYVPYHPEYNGGSQAGAGILGSFGTERGVTFYQVQLAGHELPGYSPGAAYRVMEMLLGRVKTLDESAGPFTTQPYGNFTKGGTIKKRGARDLISEIPHGLAR
ncbi:hypothetical protein EG327_011300 [Venturia inaequalis]|uniref:Carboxypeptidase n=1 Tax=Venturia inaequalis TaxID=5025 RepID=A0A8H3YP31_VENIN|nr:hypothetical protein EG327_011300 [Venturia inaequalis]